MSTTASAKTTKAISPVPIDNFGVDNGRGSGLCTRAEEQNMSRTHQQRAIKSLV